MQKNLETYVTAYKGLPDTKRSEIFENVRQSASFSQDRNVRKVAGELLPMLQSAEKELQKDAQEIENLKKDIAELRANILQSSGQSFSGVGRKVLKPSLLVALIPAGGLGLAAWGIAQIGVSVFIGGAIGVLAFGLLIASLFSGSSSKPHAHVEVDFNPDVSGQQGQTFVNQFNIFGNAGNVVINQQNKT